jgi:hypothetical protein
MDQDRILQLAVEALERKRTEIDTEISAIRAQLSKTVSNASRDVKSVATAVEEKRRWTSAARKAQSLRAKKYWAAKRAKTQEPSAVSKAISQAMRASWAKKKAQATSKNIKTKQEKDS